MKKNNVNNIIADYFLDKLITFTIFGIFIIPFLTPYSYFPLSKFFSESSVLILALALGVLGIIRSKKIAISNAGIAALLFGVFLLLQPLFIPIRLPGVNMFVALQVLVGAIMSIGVVSLIDGDEAKQKKIVEIIAWAALVSVTIQALYGFMQFTGTAENFKDYILYIGQREDGIIGNIGQKNDYVDFIAIGIFALSYLFFVRQINLIVYLCYSAFFIFVLTVATSRTPFTFFIFSLVITFVFVKLNKSNEYIKPESKRLLYLIVGLFAGLCVLELLLPKVLTLFSGRDITSGLYRFESQDIGQSTYRRFYEWYKDIVIFLSHPFFGVGWYQYPKAAIDIMSTERFMYIPANSALYTHSHNSPLNILAESGIIGFGIAIIYGFFYTLYRMFRNFNNFETLFISFMVFCIFAQGLLQYPLWYAYFLVFYILFLSIDKPKYTINSRVLYKVIATGLLMFGLGILGNAYGTYIALAQCSQVPQDMDDFTNNVHTLEDIIANKPMFVMPALMVMDNYIVPGSPQTNAVMSIQDQVKYVDMLGNQLPYPSALLKQIVYHKMIGDNQGALNYASILAHAFPFFKEQMAQQLSASPAFADEVKVINDFQYEDRSIFAKKFHRKGDLQ